MRRSANFASLVPSLVLHIYCESSYTTEEEMLRLQWRVATVLVVCWAAASRNRGGWSRVQMKNFECVFFRTYVHPFLPG